MTPDILISSTSLVNAFHIGTIFYEDGSIKLVSFIKRKKFVFKFVMGKPFCSADDLFSETAEVRVGFQI